jgi:hypothetical protein
MDMAPPHSKPKAARLGVQKTFLKTQQKPLKAGTIDTAGRPTREPRVVILTSPTLARY